jgi:hypothetical protein
MVGSNPGHIMTQFTGVFAKFWKLVNLIFAFYFSLKTVSDCIKDFCL